VAPGGHHFGTEHTLARYQNAFYRPILSDWSNFENWTDAGAKDATTRAGDIWRKVRDSYEPPALDPAIAEAVEAYIARRTDEITRG
jgi:trimethylamine--corrinoid protein Co-methyltransferase